jgi:hypothetical protein
MYCSFSLFRCGLNGHFIEILLTNEPILPVALYAEDLEFLSKIDQYRRMVEEAVLGTPMPGKVISCLRFLELCQTIRSPSKIRKRLLVKISICYHQKTIMMLYFDA